MSDVENLFETLEGLQADKKLPPVQQWQPERAGTIDIRIAEDGSWYHDGAPFRRDTLVKLFSTVLRKDGDRYYLVTPAEKLEIQVEDAPFVAVNMEVKGQGKDAELLFTSNVDDHVVADAEHPLTVEQRDGQPRPYVRIRDGLDALINRAVFYRLVEQGLHEGDELVVYSRGTRFSLGRTST
ncbi:MAG: DUF1285 domain-containing protein [Pseudomonadales bacterium]